MRSSSTLAGAAHGDDAQRGRARWPEILSALVDANRRFTQRYRVELAMRVAIHTGLVVVGRWAAESSGTASAGCRTPCRSAFAGSGPPGVVISGAHALVLGYFTMKRSRAQASRALPARCRSITCFRNWSPASL